MAWSDHRSGPSLRVPPEHERAKELAGLAQELGKVRDEHVVRKRKTVEALRESKQQSKQEVMQQRKRNDAMLKDCLLYTSPSPRDS